MQLVDHGGFADAGIAGNEHEFRRAIRHDAIEGREQRVDLALPAVQLLRDQQPVRCVVRAQRERLDAAVRLPFRQAAAKISLDARGGLVAILGGLGEQLQDDGRERGGDSFTRSPGGTGCRAMWQWTHSIGSAADEGQRSREHFVEGDAAGIEVAAGIDRPVHPAGLFGRHVGERPRDHLGRRGGLALARQTRRDTEARQPDAAGRGVDEDIGGLDVLVDETPRVHPAERGCKRDRDAQEMRHVHRAARESGPAARRRGLRAPRSADPRDEQAQGAALPTRRRGRL